MLIFFIVVLHLFFKEEYTQDTLVHELYNDGLILSHVNEINIWAQIPCCQTTNESAKVNLVFK